MDALLFSCDTFSSAQEQCALPFASLPHFQHRRGLSFVAYCQPLLQVYCSAITIPSTAFAQVTCPTLSEDNKLTWNYNIGSYLAFGYAPGDYIYIM